MPSRIERSSRHLDVADACKRFDHLHGRFQRIVAARIEALIPIAKLRVAHERDIARHDLIHGAQTVGVVGHDEPVERAR